MFKVEKNYWEEEYFNCNVFKCTAAPKELGDHNIITNLDAFISRIKEKTYLLAEIPSAYLDYIDVVQKLGFKFLVPELTFIKNIKQTPYTYFNFQRNIEPVKQIEIDAVSKIAYSSFKFGRWCVEPELPIDTANTMHSDWARNCCLKDQADEVLVAHINNDITGFIALKLYGKISKIVLIARSSLYRNKGIGSDLVNAGIRWSINNYATRMIVRTELSNIPAVNLYEKHGFTLKDSVLYYSKMI